MLDELEELALHASHLILVMWIRCEGYFKGSSMIKYTYLACQKDGLWLVFAIYGLFVFMVYWAEAYSHSCQISKIEFLLNK